MSFNVEILTPDGPILKSEVEGLTAPAGLGYLGILTGHAPMICSLSLGLVTLKAVAGPDQMVVVDQGVLEVIHGSVKILADNAWLARNELHANEMLIDRRRQKPPSLLKWMMH
jgi:F-type H+-transporting ATPase subunit epsilon